MKVVQINSECGRGSTGKITVAISKLLNEKDVENYIFYSGNHKSDYSNGIMISAKASIRIHQILSRLFGDQGFHSSFSTKRLVRKIKKIQPDAILLHNLHGYYLNLEILCKFLSTYTGKVYWTFHDCWPFTGHCAHFTINNCEKWKKGCFGCPRKKKYPYSWFFDRSKSLYQKKKRLFNAINNLTIITPSEWLATKVKCSFLSNKPIQVINNGIDLNLFKPSYSDFREKHNIIDKTIVLGVASVWSYEKGLDVFNSLADNLDSSMYQIVLVGTDDSIDEKLSSNIISIHRTQNQEELAEIYTAADVFINPTREDNYPSVNMEAIACGTPVISFDTGGCKEIVNDDCGIVINSNSTKELLNNIALVMEKLDSIKEQCAKKRYTFDQDKCFEKYIDLITK